MQAELLEMYDTHFQKIYKFFYFKTLAREQAEDLTSETFLQLAIALKINGANISDLKSYLYRIAQNTLAADFRKKYQFPTVSLENSGMQDSITYISDYVDSLAQCTTSEERLAKYLPLIPVKQANILRLRLIEKKSLAEICTQLDKDMNYVKTTQKRALKSIRQAVAVHFCTLN